MTNTIFKPVTSIDQVIQNIHRFNEGIEIGAELIHYARAWYAYKTDQGWQFGPSKFIGFQDMTTALGAGAEFALLAGRPGHREGYSAMG